MSYTDKERLVSILSRLGDDINDYLKDVKYEVIRNDDRERLGAWKNAHKATQDDRRIYVDTNNNISICVRDVGLLRDARLLAQRVANMYDLRKKIQHSITDVQGMREDNVDVEGTIEAARTNINRAITTNVDLNLQNNKHHQTFRQNSLSGFGFFSAWWHKTFFQSRAMVALEKAYDHLQQFEKKSAPVHSEPGPSSLFRQG